MFVTSAVLIESGVTPHSLAANLIASPSLAATTSADLSSKSTLHQYCGPSRLILRSNCACLTKLRNAAFGSSPATYFEKYSIVLFSPDGANILYNFFKYS